MRQIYEVPASDLGDPGIHGSLTVGTKCNEAAVARDSGFVFGTLEIREALVGCVRNGIFESPGISA